MLKINNILPAIKSIDLLPTNVEEMDFIFVEDKDSGFSFVNDKWIQSTNIKSE